ncbi:NAD(P)/FAD-dependent oxidoreductase [Modestobacter marinus]|uniref:NAD(P)/FAD-dependent oxidoreductase n=1 Tax=Modestobacter marinus TaxID=477641 RepID=UPI001C987343|nr:FAD-dependent oxidoreductase [Modestobacter marinus]
MPTSSHTVAVVGASLAGATTAVALREEGFAERIVLVGAERHLPYERPPLSKGYLLGSAARESVFVQPETWYAEHDVDLRLGVRAESLDLATRELVLDTGERLPFGQLVLATGASPRRLDVPGADQVDLQYLRTLDDSDRLRAALRPGVRVVIVGAGWIGLEVAAAARTAGADVVVLEQAAVPLGVLGPEVAGVFADLHREHGVDLRVGVGVAAVRPTGPAGGTAGILVLSDGSEVAGDLIVVGVGVIPNVELARGAGLAVDNGVAVDAALRTSRDDVLAVGDVANATHPLLGRRIRVEHWANALNQPRTAARTLLGRTDAYDRLPYFFTDQYDLGMEYSGHAAPGDYDQVVVRGDLAERAFIAFWLSGGRVVAAMNVNVWDVTEPLQRLIRSGRSVDPARLTDADVPLDDLVGTTPG